MPSARPRWCCSIFAGASSTPDLFAREQSPASARLMGVLDAVNQRWGRNTLRSARVPLDGGWAMRRELKSPCYTTQLDQLWRVGG